jgi:GDP-L-fucose synthase
MIKKTDRIFLAGHKGLVGSAILKKLKKKNYKNIVTIDKDKLDLFNQKKVFNFLKKNKPKIVIIAAAKVGGIKANNQFRADFIRENLDIQNNLIHGSYINNIKNIIFLGSSCVYPKKCKQPIKEKYLLSGALEETNEPYAVAKIAGIKMCESYNRQYKTKYLCLMPSNTFGPGDNYNEYNSHFISAILKKIYLSTFKKKSFLNLWGTGTPKREIIYVDDLAEAVVYFMNKKVKHSLINIGTSKDMTIKNYAKYILKILNINLKIRFDGKKEFDGIKRKLLDISLAKRYGWKPRANLKHAIIKTYNDLTLNYKYYRH